MHLEKLSNASTSPHRQFYRVVDVRRSSISRYQTKVTADLDNKPIGDPITSNVTTLLKKPRGMLVIAR